jgi:hypothetical protein
VRCVCEVSEIEQTVSYTTFRAALVSIVTGHAPAWYSTALRPCQTVG